MINQTKPNLSGVFAAALTRQTADGSPDLDGMARHCRWLLANGCDGLAILGTTGEANSFSVDERMAIMESLVEAGIPASVMMPGTGCCAIPDTVKLTKCAVNLGAAGVLALPPFYYKGVSDDGLIAAFCDVIEQVGDDRLRLYLYHFPQMAGVPIPYGVIEGLLKHYPKTVAGMKDSSGDLDNMAGAAKAFPGFEVFSGADDLFHPLLKAGGVGCITACCNIASALLGKLYAIWREPAAQALHEQATNVRKVCASYPLVPVLKETMARHTGDNGWRAMRPPLMALTDADARELGEKLAATGLVVPPVP
ncbi:MAG: dihydrodipicolinate synthase family protein [Rhodospirillales bacterium]|nr:dihydrodipicolinate synthase family protein [Rhodospirillales bacterium]